MENLKTLLDTTYITGIFCEITHDHYNFINNYIMLPTILWSSLQSEI